MRINRVAENLKALDEVSSCVFNPEVARNIILMDISRSLSVIADELTRRDDDHEDHYQGLIMSMTLEGDGIGTRYVCTLDTLENVLDVIGVNSYEELVGSYCKAKFLDFILRDIGNIINDKWLILKEVNHESKD